MKTLTNRQAAILDFISETIVELGLPPSVREIGKAFEIRSLRGVTVHLDALERKGYIGRLVDVPRGITVLKNSKGESGRFVFVLDGAA